MKTKVLILFFSLFLFSHVINAQINVKSDGRINLGSSITGFRMSSSGQWILGTNSYDDGYFGAKIRIHPKDEIGLLIYNNHSFNYGDVLKIVTDRPKTAAIAVWNGTSEKSFWVYGDGEVYSRGQLIMSDARLKKNIENIDSPLDKVLSLRGVTFEREDASSLLNNNTLDISPQIQAQINSERKRKHIGVLAQEVESVIPEAVRTTQDGTKAVAYSELIGLLIEAIKEQQLQIEELRSTIAVNTVINSDAISLSDSKLYQNIPNPANQTTIIKYFIVDGGSNSYLNIYNLQGVQIRSFSITNKGEGSLSIDCSELGAGIYLYSLIVKGKVIDTKRMVLVK